MSIRRLLTIFDRDFSFNTRRAMFWVWVFLLVFLAWSLSSGKVRIQSGDSSVGGTKSFITSEFAVTQLMAVFTPLIYGFFVSVAAGMSVINDDEVRVGSILHATSLRPGEYIWGKFLAVIASTLLVIALQVGAMLICNHALPAGEAGEFRGPLVLSNYVKPALVFCLPTVIFFAGISFYIGERTRRPILVFVFPVLVLLSCMFLLWDFSPSWLDPRLDKLMMLVDPAGFRWLTETQLKVDRGVKFYNTESVPMDGLIVANRLIVMGLGLLAVALTHRHFASTLRGTSRKAERAWKLRANEASTVDSGTGMVLAATAPLASLEMTARRPGLIRGAWHVFKSELVEIRSSPGLYLFVPLLILEAVSANIVAVGPFDTALLSTPGNFAMRSFNALTTMLCLLLMFYTVESLWRERHTRLAAISLATPVRTGSLLLGKALANSFVGVIIMGFMLVTAVGWIAYQGKVPFRLEPFMLTWGLLLVPTLFLWTAFVMVTLTITRNRYLTYAIALGSLIFTGYRQITGEMNWLGNWPLWSAVSWSDISILEFDRLALVLNRVMAVGLAVLFVAVTAWLFPRRELDAVGVAGRFRFGRLFRSMIWLLPIAVVPLVAGGVLWAKVDRGFQGEATKKLEKDYWRKNLATYRDWPLPDITAVDISVTLEPDQSKLAVTGTYGLINNQEKPLIQIPVTGGLHWEDPEWTLDGKPVKPVNRAGLYVFTPEKPIATNGTAKLGFKFHGVFPGGVTKVGGGTGQFILPSGVVLQSFGTSFAPAIGYIEEAGVDKDNRYETKEFPDDFYVGQTNALFGPRRPYKTRVTVEGPASMRYNSVGKLVSEKVDGRTRKVVWESDQPVNFFNIVGGQWSERAGKGTVVYYHDKHQFNIDRMVEGLDAARTYYSQWFYPYPWENLKLSEFPSLASYAQGFPTDITFSESIGFLTDDDDETSAALTITAHEAAHQWWGNIVTPGKGPGGNLLSEGTSHFSTMLLLEQLRGAKARNSFARKIEDSYAKARSADSERPLVKTDGSRNGDQSVTYDKTGFVLWMLMKHMGREPMLAGIREFFVKYRTNPDHPVLQDLLASLRPHAADPAAFDAFTKQWFFEVVMPEYQLSDVSKTKEGDTWVVKATVKNVGTGTMPIDLAATVGEPYPPKDAPAGTATYQKAVTSVILSAGESKEVIIRSTFEPRKVIVDPDLNVLMLRRKSAETSL